MKSNNTQSVELAELVDFDSRKIRSIKFDLKHINQGWDAKNKDYSSVGSKRNTQYTADEVVEFFEQFGYFEPEWELGRNKEAISIKGIKYFRYVGIVVDYTKEDEQKRIVIDIEDDN